MEVFIKKSIYRKIQKFPKKAQYEILKAFELLQHFPFIRLNIIKMRGKNKIFRIRIGRYRILFIFEKNKIYVFDVGIRGRLY